MHEIETLSINRVLNEKHFYEENHAENVHQKLTQTSFFNLVNNPKYFERGLSKSLKKINLFFLSNPVPFNRQDYEKGT